jgi:hypothetical protein
MIKIDELLIDIIDDAFNKIAWQGPMHLINIIEQLLFILRQQKDIVSGN